MRSIEVVDRSEAIVNNRRRIERAGSNRMLMKNKIEMPKIKNAPE